MKFIIIDQLSCLAHINTTQPQQIWFKLSIIIQYIQYIAILLPIHGWNQWNYQDGHFKLFSMIAQSQLIIPILAESTINFTIAALIFTILYLITILTIILILLLFGIYDNKNPLEHNSIRNIIFNFLLITTNIFQMPLLFLFISQILSGHKTLNYQNQTLGLQSIINFFTLLLYSLQVFFSQYILRTYTFMPINNLQYKFNVFQPLHFILQTIIAILAFIEDDNALQYAQIAIIHISLTFKICESYFTKPQLPFMNHLNFICSVIVEFINIIVSISIFTKGSLIDESQVLYTILFASTILYNLADTIYTRNILQTYIEMNTQTCISFTQQMHSYYKSNRYILKPEFFKLYFYYRSHKLNCPKQQKQHKVDNYTQQTTQIISCILSTELEKAKNDSKMMYEDLQLFYINFLAEFQNRPLIAFVELKRYENILNQQSNFFKGAKYYIALKLQRLILSQQNYYKQFQIQLQQTQQEKQLSISSIFETLTFQEEYIPKILQIIQEKIYFWNHQIKGFSTIYEIQRLALQQSQKVQDLGLEISKFCNFNIQSLDHLVQSSNVLNIKFISIFYSVVMNDYYGTQICEQTIAEIYNIEHAQSEDIINNISFIEETAIIILLSMVRNRGQIVNKDKKLLAKYFEFGEQEFNQIDNIGGLMPQYFAEVHDSLLNDFLMTSKSIFFDDYKMLFGLSMQGFLVPQQLKLENDFSHIDDYVLIGCMSRIKSSSDFVLFSDDGYLIGCTQNFYDIFFQFTEQSSKFTPLYIHQINVYMLFPNIIDLLAQVKNEGTQQCTDNYCRIIKFNSLKDLLDEGVKVQQSIKQFASINYDRSQTIQKSRTSQTTIDKTKVLQQLADGIDNKIGKQKIIHYLQSLTIFNIVIQNSIMESIKKDENKQKQSYQCKVDLCYKIMGRKIARQTYFVLEIQDIRKIDETKTFDSIANNKQFSNTQFPTTYVGQKSSENNSHSQILNTETGLEQASVAIENVAPEVKKMVEASVLCNKNDKKFSDISKYDSQIQESGRDSYAPISQRIQFISPTSKQSQQQQLIEKEFSELMGELNYVSAEVINEIDSPDPSQIKGFSSNENKDKKENLLQQLQHNQQNQKREDLEISARRSRSSNTSGTSGVSAIQVIKQFQQQKTFTQSLLTVFYINVLVIICILIYIIIHLINVDNYHNDLMETLIHITAPLYFNRDFFKAFCCVWSLVFGQLQIVGTSDFILQQTIEAIKELADTMIDQIRSMYGTFVSIEVAGLLSNINLAFLYEQSETVSFTYFVNFIQNIVDLLFQAQYSTVQTLDQLIDVNYLNNLLTLRYNLKNVKLMNVELLDSLNLIFLEQLDIKIQEYQVQISIEIIVLCLIVFIQIYYWNQLEKYCQQILLLVGRLQENQAQEQIIRFSFVSETLLTLQGKQSWKQQNYYSLIYQPLNLIGIESQYTQSKILKDYKLRLQGGGEKKQKFIHHQVDDGIKKPRKNQNVVLNSRINDSNISILKEFLFITITYVILSIYIIGGYLIYNQQSTDLYPTQQLALNFIRFTSEQDITVSAAFVIKSQELLYSTLIERQFYTEEQVQSQQQGAIVLFNIFIDYHDTYFENLTSIYEYIIASNSINNEDEQLLLTLYSEDYCLEFSTTIPFCDIKSDFNSTYGEPDPEDNVREYLSQGIQGVVSRIDSFFKQYYQYEIINKTYNPDLQHVQKQMHEPDFFHVIFEHFLYTTQGTYLFIDTIINILKDVMLKDQISIYYYYLITGIILILLYILVYSIWFYKTNNRLILLRLILTNLPIETLTEAHTLTLLKRLK